MALPSHFFFYIWETLNTLAMKKSIIILSVLLMSVVSLNAQRRNFMYPDKASMAFFDSVKFVNPQFYPGVVISQGGKQSGGPVNICTVDQKLHFIGDGGDTLVIKNNESIERVYILGRAYINSKYGFLEMLDAVDDVTLCELNITDIHTDAAPGAYGLKTQTSAVKSLTCYDMSDGTLGNTQMMKFDINQEFAFSHSRKPFLLVDGEAYPVSKKNLVKYFPEQEEIISEFLEDNNFMLTSVAQVRELFKALNQ